MNFTLFHELSCNNGGFIVTGLMGLSMETLKKQDWTECLWQNNVYNAIFSDNTRLEHGFAIKIHVFPMIITVCTQLSLIQLIRRFKLHVV